MDWIIVTDLALAGAPSAWSGGADVAEGDFASLAAVILEVLPLCSGWHPTDPELGAILRICVGLDMQDALTELSALQEGQGCLHLHSRLIAHLGDRLHPLHCGWVDDSAIWHHGSTAWEGQAPDTCKANLAHGGEAGMQLRLLIVCRQPFDYKLRPILGRLVRDNADDVAIHLRTFKSLNRRLCLLGCVHAHLAHSAAGARSGALGRRHNSLATSGVPLPSLGGGRIVNLTHGRHGNNCGQAACGTLSVRPA
mmetsp:Transcript_118027/g.252099  ORF Transcript_118027/g.252099 Transcript_118027/m.252099 type:complete len:252 (-) Transcript_118027:31-786(-)